MKPKSPTSARPRKNGSAKLSVLVPQVIRLADAVRTYWDTELPKRHRDYPIVHPDEDDGPPPPEAVTLTALLQSLPTEMLDALAALALIGRGGFDISDLPAALRTAKERFDTPRYAVARMIEMASLADYLSDGLSALEKARIDVDQLVPKRNGSPRP